MRLATSLPYSSASKSAPPDSPLQHDMALRLLAATLGSYLLCFALIAALQLLLPLKLKPVLTLLPFIICATSVFWAFRARDVWHAWIAMLLAAALCGAVILLRG